jgi:hypothetical protein
MTEKPKIAVKGVLQDIRAGMDDPALMEKYRLSAKGLQSLFEKMVSKGVVSAEELDQRPTGAGEAATSEPAQDSDKKGALISPAEAVRDIRSGMHDFDLMSKYRLSSKGLESLFSHLVKAGLLEQSELESRMPTFEATVEIMPRGLTSSGDDAQAALADEQELDLNWECPVCGIYQTREYARCPECGALVALLKRNRST